MKTEIINSILCMLQGYGVDTDEIENKLYLIMKDCTITPTETALAIRNEMLNDTLVKRFIAAKMVKGCTQKTIKLYSTEIPKIIMRIGKSVPDITADDIRLYIAVRLQQDKVMKATIDNEIRYLRTFYAFLIAEELVTKNPMLKIEKIRSEKKKKHAFTELDCEKLRNACRTALEKCVIELLLSTGCRVSELVQMRIDEIDGDKITVHGKGEKDRTVYFNAKAQIALNNYLAERKDTNPYLFPKGYWNNTQKLGVNDSPYWYRNPDAIADGHRDGGGIEAMMRSLGKRAGVENCHPHRFRRTCATFALRRGMALEQVSRMLGHANIATTQIYLDLTEDELRQAHAKYVV